MLRASRHLCFAFFRKGCASITLYGEYSTLDIAALALLAWDLGGIYSPMERIIESLVGTKRTLESDQERAIDRIREL